MKYRWVRSDGSRGSVKTLKVRSAGIKKTVVRDRQSFDWDTRGWQAVEILGRKGLSGKAHFSVSCSGGKPVVYNGVNPLPPAPQPQEPTRAAASVAVTPPAYTGPCPAAGQPVRFDALIQVNRVPARVAYQWIDSADGAGPVQYLDFAAGGPRSQTVALTHPVKVTTTGWKSVDIVSPAGSVDSLRGNYSVTCDEPEPEQKITPAAAVDKPAYTGSCPVALTFTGSITVTRVPAKVRYQWRDSEGGVGPEQELEFTGEPGSKPVAPHTMTIGYDREVPTVKGAGMLRILSPETDPDVAEAAFTVNCTGGGSQPPAPVVSVSDMKVNPASYTGPCRKPADVARHVSAKITAAKPMTVRYQWVDEQGRPWFGSGPFSTTFYSAGSKTVANGFSSVATARGSVRLKIVEPAGGPQTEAVTFSTVCVNPSVSDAGKRRTDENEECGNDRPAEFALSAKLTVADGPASVGYRWYRKSTETRNQWVFVGGGTASFTGTGKQEQTITGRYATQRSETGSFKVVLTDPYEGGTTPPSP
nr:hypothetical protein GCM10020093_045720 [Planobispora longispora]